MTGWFGQLWHDAYADLVSLWHNHSALIVIALTLIPWAVYVPLRPRWDYVWEFGQIGAFIVLYWFASRRARMETPAVRQVERETIFALALVLLWVLWRVANYAGGIQISCAGPGWCVDWCAVIVPKMLGMVIVPVVVLKLARYTFTALGLSIARRVWLPALAPILALVALGLNAQGAEAFGLSALCFFFSAGLPEEVLFRGVLQTRLEAWLKNPAWALFLASFIFGASHLPINLHGFGLADWMDAVGAAFTFQMGYGFAFGLAYQRVRNLWPLAVVHALVDAAS